MPMHILIVNNVNTKLNKYLQNRTTGSYVRSDGTMTISVEDAHRISNITEALNLCRQHRLREMDLVMKFSNAEYDVRLQLENT